MKKKVKNEEKKRYTANTKEEIKLKAKDWKIRKKNLIEKIKEKAKNMCKKRKEKEDRQNDQRGPTIRSSLFWWTQRVSRVRKQLLRYITQRPQIFWPVTSRLWLLKSQEE